MGKERAMKHVRDREGLSVEEESFWGGARSPKRWFRSKNREQWTSEIAKVSIEANPFPKGIGAYWRRRGRLSVAIKISA
jgi:hypothetical protein